MTPDSSRTGTGFRLHAVTWWSPIVLTQALACAGTQPSTPGPASSSASGTALASVEVSVAASQPAPTLSASSPDASASSSTGSVPSTTQATPTASAALSALGMVPPLPSLPLGVPDGDPAPCALNVSASVSEQIATVGIVTFTTDLTPIEYAAIEFGLPGAERYVAPVDLSAAGYRTLLLGMKQSKEYTFKVKVTGGGKTCTSSEQTLQTGDLPQAPSVTKNGLGSGTPGFYVTSDGLGANGGSGARNLFIFDKDGDVVWAASGPPGSSRARMDWEGQNLWGMALNVASGTGRMDRISMDGQTVESNIPALIGGHHDFTVVPGGKVVVLAWVTPETTLDCTHVIEYDPATQAVVEVVANVSSVYKPVSECHTNAIQYQEWDDTFTLGDRNPNLFVRIKHDGSLLWQLGGSSPVDDSKMFQGAELVWNVNHGHHLLPDGRFIMFNNNAPAGGAQALEFVLDETTLTATRVGQFAGGTSLVLGDVQRLPNGNTTVTYSSTGVIREYDASGNQVVEFTGKFGYSDYRRTLYGKPTR